MSGTSVTCRDVVTGESESITITDDHLIVTDGRSYISSVVAYANGTQIVTIKKAETADEARSFSTSITRHFSKAALR